jgi:hypothetical protein
LFSKKNIFSIIQQYNIGFFWKHFLRFFDFFQNEPQIFLPEEILSLKSSILPIAMKVRSKDAAESPASFALLFVQNYVILDLSDKIYTGGWWIPKCSFFTALKSDNARMYVHIYTYIYYMYTTCMYVYKVLHVSLSRRNSSTPVTCTLVPH